MSKRLLEIGAALGKLYQSRRGAQIEMAHQQEDYIARLLSITPEGGWPGKNEEARALSKQQAEYADEALCAIRANQNQLKADLNDIEADIEEITAERRAIEWTIRDQLVTALCGQGDRDDVAEDDNPNFYDGDFDTALDAATVSVASNNGHHAPADEGEPEIPF